MPRAEGKLERRSAEWAGEVVRLEPDVLVTQRGRHKPAPAKKATSTIPIVMTNTNDPVGNGFISSFARPGGNITGLIRFSPWR